MMFHCFGGGGGHWKEDDSFLLDFEIGNIQPGNSSWNDPLELEAAIEMGSWVEMEATEPEGGGWEII